MNRLAQDRYIKSIFKTDNYIDLKIDENINRFIEEKEKTIARKSIKISLNAFSMIAIATSFILVIFIGINIRAKMLGKPNIISTIQALVTKAQERYQEEYETQVNEAVVDDVVLPNNNETTNTSINTSNVNDNPNTPTIINEQQAREKIIAKYGLEDPNTGIAVEYVYKGMYKDKNNKEYYSFDMEWLYSLSEIGSYLTTIYVSKDGTEIKEGYNQKNISNENNQQINVEDTNKLSTIPKEKTELISDVFVTFPNVPVDKITLYDGTQIGSGISINDNIGSCVDIYNTSYCNEYYHFKNFNDIRSYIRDNTDAEIETLIINGQQWLVYRETYSDNTKGISLLTVKNDNSYEVSAGYNEESEKEIFKILNSIKIPE